LLFNQKELLKRDIEKNKKWYEFGRSQGLQNCNKEKFVVNTLIKENIDFYYLPADIFVYSGIFITKKNNNVDWEILKNSLNSKEFKRYIQIKGKDFSNGYKSITTSLIKEFPLIF
jgi:adenine-specific DNA-methyltransferase